MADPKWCVLLFFGFSLALAMPPNDVMKGGVPLSAEMSQSRQAVPTEDFSGGFSRDFAQNLPTNEFMGDFGSVPAADENSLGFIIGVPSNFPAFSSLGGFEPMPHAGKNDKDASFVPEFNIPVVNIPDLQDNQPQFNLPQFTQQRQGSLTLYREDLSDQEMKPKKKVTRRRRTAGEPDPIVDPSMVPHRRVHRVQTDDQIPHSRNPREFQVIRDSQTAFSDLPYHVEPFPAFQFPVFQSERIGASGNPGREFRPAPRPRGVSRKVEVRTSDDDFIVPESQRFYPTFNPRLPPSVPPPRTSSFFPSSPPLPRTPGPRGGRFNGHGPGFRESPSIRDIGGFRDFHETFYGPGAREAINRPDFAFPSSRRPAHREEEKLDNTLLGSGNFEILSGGTFYDDDDPDIHHGYDHLLNDGYYGSHVSHNDPHSNNHVDDFFSNFRDFSEFAARRSDEGETILDDSSYFGHGYASEHIHQVINSSHPDFQDAIDNKKVQEEDRVQADKQTGKKTEKKTLKKTEEKVDKKTKEFKFKLIKKKDNKYKQHTKHRQPKNIQEVLEDLEAQPSDYLLSSLTVDEKDPMIAMF